MAHETDDVDDHLKRAHDRSSNHDQSTEHSPQRNGSEQSQGVDRAELSDEELARRLDDVLAGFEIPKLLDAPNEGFIIGNYRTMERIGSGAFGIVYLAQHVVTKRHAAVKIPRREVLENPELLSRFASEAVALTHLNHPGIVRVHHAEADGPTPFIAAAYCPGPSVREWMDANSDPSKRPWEQVCRLITTVADTVNYAHAKNVYHRDLKPENILLFPVDGDSNPDRPLADHELTERDLDSYLAQLTDFGLAKLTGLALNETRSSLLLGTAAYMSAEQLEGREAGGPPASCDVYSLGVILYELLFGRLPSQGRNYIDTIDRARSGVELDVRSGRSDLPKSLGNVLRNSLHLNPHARYTSAGQLADDLRRCMNDDRVRARHASPLKSLRFWSGHPKRIVDAGRFMLWSNVLVAAWSFIAIAGVYYFSKAPLDDWSVIRDWLIIAVSLELPAAYLGYKTMRGHQWAIRFGFLFSFAFLFVPIIAIVEGPALFRVVYEGDPFLTFMVHLMLLICFIVQLGLFGAAVRADHILRTSNGRKSSQRNVTR